MSLGKITGVRTVHRVPSRGLRPSQHGFDAGEVDTIEIVGAGVVYDLDGKRRLIPWSSVAYVELEPPPATPKRGAKD